MTTGAIITQIILSVTNLTLIGVGIFAILDGTYPIGAHVSLWGAFLAFSSIQSLFLWSDLK